jgi:hypothetical protein
MTRSTPFEKHEDIRVQPRQPEQQTEQDHDGERASGMTEIGREVVANPRRFGRWKGVGHRYLSSLPSISMIVAGGPLATIAPSPTVKDVNGIAGEV